MLYCQGLFCLSHWSAQLFAPAIRAKNAGLSRLVPARINSRKKAADALPTRARRIQLSAAEKKVMAERIKTDRLDANLLFLVQEWNEEYLERSISWNHLKRIRDDIPLISTQEEFWDSVSSEV